MYSVQFTRHAHKDYLKLPPKYQQQAAKAIGRLRQDPRIGEPLKGKLKGKWRIRFSNYRIIYRILNQQLLIIVFEVRHRKDVYR